MRLIRSVPKNSTQHKDNNRALFFYFLFEIIIMLFQNYRITFETSIRLVEVMQRLIIEFREVWPCVCTNFTQNFAAFLIPSRNFAD